MKKVNESRIGFENTTQSHEKSKHISNWSMTLTRQDEGNLTAAAIPMVQSLGIAFGAAAGGLIANAAALESGLDRSTVAEAADWIYGFCVVPPFIAVVLGWRLRVLRDRFAS